MGQVAPVCPYCVWPPARRTVPLAELSLDPGYSRAFAATVVGPPSAGKGRRTGEAIGDASWLSG